MDDEGSPYRDILDKADRIEEIAQQLEKMVDDGGTYEIRKWLEGEPEGSLLFPAAASLFIKLNRYKLGCPLPDEEESAVSDEEAELARLCEAQDGDGIVDWMYERGEDGIGAQNRLEALLGTLLILWKTHPCPDGALIVALKARRW